jgi:hypothetical protein
MVGSLTSESKTQIEDWPKRILLMLLKRDIITQNKKKEGEHEI